MSGNLCIIIPAAGASSRMRGQDKLLLKVDGEALLARQVRLALGTGGRVLVTLPSSGGARRDVVRPLACDRLEVSELEEAGEGIAASLRAGARWARGGQACGLMILLADMPGIEAEDLERVIAAFRADPARVVRATTEDGRRGHPVIFPPRLFADLLEIRGDKGGRDVLAREDVDQVRLPGQRAVTDLDTPEDWDRWQRCGKGRI